MKIFLPYVVRVIILSTIILFTCKVNSQSDFLTQHIEDNVTNNGFVNTSITPVSSLTNAFVLANNNRRVSAGQSGLTSNANAIDLSAARALTATNSLTYYKQNNTLNTRINSSIWEYIGPAGGPNEMIVRGRYAVNLNGGTNSTTVGLSGISNSQNCIPFITGIRTNVATQGADSSTAIAYLENNTTLRVEKGSNTNNVIINITLVEFTGSNWTVLHGDSGNSASDTATITLRNNADGSGTATSINDWSEAIIFGQHRGDNNANGVNDAIADNWPLFQPGGSNQTVDWTFDANHDSNGTNRQFVHVLHNTNLTVTRFTDTQNAADESTINISSAGLTDVNQALIVGSSISSGGGQAYGRGWRNYYLKSSSEAAHWAHRNNNTMSHEIQIVDLSNLTSSSCSTTIASFPYNEGFETGLGDWSQDTTNDDRDWTRQSGGTPSNNTGPSAAHEGSFYVFTEGSNPNFNSEFNLISPCIDLTSETSASLSFYYHMYGTNMGTLDVEVSTDGGSTFGTPEWSISGEVQTSNAQAWEQATVVLDAYTGQVIQIRFSGLTGADFTSDMAIDDISVTTGAVVSTCSASTLTLPYTESFETGTNGWASGGTDASRINNPTNSFDNDYSLMIRSNSGNASSFCSPSMDITSYDKVDFDFYFTAINFEQDELFYVEYSDDDGTTWTIAKIFEAGDVEGASDVRGDFDINNSTIFYNKTVTLQSTDYTFSSNSRFRVRSAASDATDMVYIDNISITGVTYSNPTIGPGGVTNDLDLWLRADRFDGTTVGTDGSLVTAWIDNGRGNDARTKATGLEPIYRNSTARNINFNPVIDFENDPTTAGSDMTYIDPRDKVLQGTGGFNSDDIFMVVIPDPVISTAILPLDTFTSTDPTGNTFDEDVTGFGYGNYSQRFTNENFGYAIGTSNAAGNGYGRGVTNTAINYNRVHIMNTRHNASDSDMEIYMNANQIGTVTSDVSDFAAVNNTRYWLGRSQYFQGSFDGRIAEVITYRARKDDADATQERNRIQSYLAIKYGITLEPTITAGVIEEGNLDYVDSDGSVIWDVSASAGFNFDIAGIGRDDASGLDQRQSSSINSIVDGTGETRGIVTMGLTSIEDTNSQNKTVNASSSFTDKNFIMWGNNNASLDAAPSTVAVDMSANIAGLNTNVEFIGMQRIWKVVETGDVDRVQISIPQNAVRNITPPGSYLMFISDTGVFTPTAQYRVMTDDGSGNLIAEYDFPANTERYITFGYAPEIIVQRSINFDASALNYIDVEDNLDLNSAFTLSTWIKRASDSRNKSIISKRDVGYSQGYDLKILNNQRVELSWINGGSHNIRSSVAIPEDVWHHIAVTHDGTTARLYIDGVLETTETLPLPADTSQSFLIAAAGRDGSTTAHFDGNIDEVRVWNTALNQDQLRFLMNQELEDNPGTIGKYFDDNSILPTKNDASSLDFSNLRAYFPMSRYTYTNTNDDSGNDLVGYLRQLRTVDFQTAPLPYVSTQNGNWTDNSTWTNGAMQTIPGARALADNEVYVNWNIVETAHDITIDNTSLFDDTLVNLPDPDGNDNEGNRTVLAHILSSGTVTVDGDNTAKTGFGYTVTHYLELNGMLDLEGESQLIQTTDSDLILGPSGELEKDQQGTTNTYHYNYWSAPVGDASIDPTNITNENRYSYSVTDIMFDGGSGVNFSATGYDGSNTSPVTIADYWIWKFANQTDGDYSQWQHVRRTGTILPGEGFTMKGPGSTGTEQNYTFRGNPNNADINLTINQYNDYLVGNPYASAIDARQFIIDNGGTLFFDQGLIRIVLDGSSNPVLDGNGHPIYQDDDGNQYTMLVTVGGTPVNDLNGNPIYQDAAGNPHYAHLDGGGSPILDGNGYMLYIITGYVGEDDATTSGTLYFWEHWGGGDHILQNYEGGYGTYNLAGSIAAPFASAGTSDPDVSPTGSGTKAPGRYIPVGQGFFVVADNGGTINFNNGQRVFKKESTANGEFFRTANPQEEPNDVVTEDIADPRTKFKFSFVSAAGQHRQLLLTIDDNTTPDADWGYDATTYEYKDDDMFWAINNDNNFYVIQASNSMDEETSYPLIVYTASDGNNTFKVDELINLDEEQEVFIHDIELDFYHNLKEGDYEIYLNAGYYDNRFEIVFYNPNAQSLGTDDDIINQDKLDVLYANNTDKVVLINPHNLHVTDIQIFNILGQHVVDIKNIKSGNQTEYNVGKLSSGPYIIKLNTVSGSVSKKILID